MSVRSKALLWAAIIIASALIMSTMGLSSGASFGVISGLSGAAWGTLQADGSCGRGCLE